MERRETPPDQPGAVIESTRREFIGKVGAGLLTLAGMIAASPKPAGAEAAGPGSTDPCLRMQDDLRRALRRPVASRRWAMAIDLAKCVGCHGCTVACRAENKTPPGVTYRPVLVETEGTYPAPRRRFVPRPCMHCEQPACLEVCPAEAIKRRPDGIVYIDYDQCQGIQNCVPACPYGIPAFDSGQYFTDGTPARQAYETAPAFEMGARRARDNADRPPIGKARKCHYCWHRLEAGMLPACTTTCIGNATFFGDLNDSESLIAELARSPRVRRLNEEAGTKPTTFYLT